MAHERRQTNLKGSAAAAAVQQVSDETLVARAVSLADDEAFEALMRRHQQRIHHLLLRFSRDRTVAEDLCQDTFLQAWHKLSSYQGRGSFAGWLAKVAYNVFLQHRRRNRHHPELSLDEPRVATGGDQALTSPPPVVEAPDLERLLAVVSPDERTLLTLSYGAGLSAREIGEMVGSSAGTVKSQIHRAKQKIRRYFHIEAEE